MFLATAERAKSSVTVRVHAIDGVQAEIVSIAHKTVEEVPRRERVTPARYGHLRGAFVASAVSLDRSRAVAQARQAVVGACRR